MEDFRKGGGRGLLCLQHKNSWCAVCTTDRLRHNHCRMIAAAAALLGRDIRTRGVRSAQQTGHELTGGTLADDSCCCCSTRT